MNPAPTWIETGSNGRPYLVRKKTKLPSTSRLTLNALVPWKRSSLPFFSTFRQEDRFLPAVSDPPERLQLPSSTASSAASESGTIPHTPQPPSLPPHPMMYQLPYPQQNQSQQNGKETHQTQPNHALRHAMQPYMPPMAHMYHSMPMQHQYPPTMFPGALGQPPTLGQPPPHPNFYPPQSFPPPPQSASPHSMANGLKHKCRICGRFRSSAYHQRHPLAPGQIPEETVCTKCQRNITYSDESSDESLDRRLRQARSQSRQASTAVVVREPLEPRRGRSLSRASIRRHSLARESELHDRRYLRSFSRSSSLDVGPLRISVEDNRPHRHREPSVEVTERVRYLDEPPVARPAYIEETVYVEDDGRSRPRRVYGDEYYDGDVDYGYPRRFAYSIIGGHVLRGHRTRLVSRPPTPVPRLIHRYSNPLLPAPDWSGQHAYDNKPNSVVEESRELVRHPRQRSLSRSRSFRLVSVHRHSEGSLQDQRTSSSSYRDLDSDDYEPLRGRRHPHDRGRRRQGSYYDAGMFSRFGSIKGFV